MTGSVAAGPWHQVHAHAAAVWSTLRPGGEVTTRRPEHHLLTVVDVAAAAAAVVIAIAIVVGGGEDTDMRASEVDNTVPVVGEHTATVKPDTTGRYRDPDGGGGVDVGVAVAAAVVEKVPG